MSHWWLYLSLCLHGTNTWWGCCIIYPCWLHATHLCLLHLQFVARPIHYLIPSHAFNFSIFIIGHVKLTWLHTWFPSCFWSHFWRLDPEVSVSAHPRTHAFHLACLSLLNVTILTFAAGTVTLTGMAPSLLPMRRLSCALLHSWPTTWPTHLFKYTCLQYAPFTLTMTCRILSSTAKFEACAHRNKAGSRSIVTQMPLYHPGSSAGDSAGTGLRQERPCDAVGGMLIGFLWFPTS